MAERGVFALAWSVAVVVRSVDDCPFRSPAEGADDGDLAHCSLIEKISGLSEPRHREVARSVCTACCEDREPSEEDPNSTLASLLWSIANRVAADGFLECSPERVDALKRVAARNLHRVMDPSMGQDFTSLSYAGLCFYLGEPMEGDHGCYTCLHERHASPTTIQQCKDCFDYDLRLEKGEVRNWMVGLTTAPREESTLAQSLHSLAAAGWETPHVFAEPETVIPECVRPEDVTVRPQTMGAWPNWLLSVTELYLRSPDADAYLIVQDDVVYPQGLREYLEGELWPAERLGIVSLHTASHMDTLHLRGFYPTEPGWKAWGAQAYVIPNAGVRSLMRNRRVQNHRHRGPNNGTRNVDSVLGMWCQDVGLPYYLHTPSLSQHIGESSTLWGPKATTTGRRSAVTFPGEDVDIREVVASAPDQGGGSTNDDEEAMRKRSLAIVCVLIGKRDPFDSWRTWMLESHLPFPTTLYLVDNSEDAEFSALLREAVDELSSSERFERVKLQRGPGPAKEKVLSIGRCTNIANTLNGVLGRTSEDMVLVVDCDTIPPPFAVALLAGELRGERCALVSGCYESANLRGYFAAARAPLGWGKPSSSWGTRRRRSDRRRVRGNGMCPV